MTRKFARWLVVCLTVLLLVQPAAFAVLKLSKTTPDPRVAPKDPCGTHNYASCWATALDLQVLTAGRNEGFETALGTALAGRWDPTDWTFVPGAALDITVTVKRYGAYNDCPGWEGSVLVLERPADATLDWVQVVQTNRSNWPGIERYLDTRVPQPGDAIPPIYPLEFADGHFEDQPGRACEYNKHIYWEGYLYLANVDAGAKKVTYREGIFWGFTVDCIPEPSALVLFAGGGGWFLMGVFRRRR